MIPYDDTTNCSTLCRLWQPEGDSAVVMVARVIVEHLGLDCMWNWQPPSQKQWSPIVRQDVLSLTRSTFYKTLEWPLFCDRGLKYSYNGIRVDPVSLVIWLTFGIQTQFSGVYRDFIRWTLSEIYTFAMSPACLPIGIQSLMNEKYIQMYSRVAVNYREDGTIGSPWKHEKMTPLKRNVNEISLYIQTHNTVVYSDFFVRCYILSKKFRFLETRMLTYFNIY